MKPYRLAIVETHPIHYLAPIYRVLAADPEVELMVIFASDHSVRGGMDHEFGVQVAWDAPLLEGYNHVFIRNRPLPLWPRYTFSYYCPTLHSELERLGINSVLINSYSRLLDWQAASSAWRLKLALLVRLEGDDLARSRGSFKELLRRQALSSLYRRVDAYLSIGRRSRDHFLAHDGDPDKIFSSPYCVENTLFRQETKDPAAASRLREQLGLARCRAVALYCGKLIPKKDPLLLARAVGLMERRGQLGLLVIGEGELRARMEEAVAGSGVGASALVGFIHQRELPAYYNAADFLVLPSSFGETWGLVVNEAMSMGLPAVVSDRVGCADDLVEEGKTGYVFPAGDARGLAARLDQMLQEPEKIARMGDLARERVKQYSVEEAAAGIKRALVAVGSRRT